MKHPINELAITASVGQFIREVRNGNKRPSMYTILHKNGVHSANRARQLIARMIENKIIHRHRDGSFSLCHQNYDMAEVMPVLLKRTYNRRPKEVVQEVLEEIVETVVTEDVITSLQDYTAQDLVTELRSRGYAVTCCREVITIETL